MRSQLDSGKDSRRTIGTTDNTQCSRFLRCETNQHSHQQYSKDTQLRCRPKDRETQVTKHRSEVGQSTHTHEDDRRQEPCLNQHIIDEVHQSQIVCNFMQRHFPNVLHYSIYQNHSILICLDDAHLSTGKVSNEHTESDRYQQQRFVMLFDTQIQQNESNGIHHQKRRISNDVAESRHIVESCKYFFHRCLSYLH